MKKALVTAGLAAAIATTSFAGTAMAEPYYWHHHYYHHYRNVGPALAAGAIFGLIGSAIGANAYYHRPYYGYPYGYYHHPYYYRHYYRRPFFRDWDDR